MPCKTLTGSEKNTSQRHSILTKKITDLQMLSSTAGWQAGRKALTMLPESVFWFICFFFFLIVNHEASEFKWRLFPTEIQMSFVYF